MLLFFFFKQKTAYEMRISDWSSDVCSSDLQGAPIKGADDLDRAGIEQRIGLLDRGGTGSDGGIGHVLQQPGHALDLFRIDQRFVALYIDHDGIGRQSKLLGALGPPVGAGGVVGSRQQCLEADRKGTRMTSSHYCASC